MKALQYTPVMKAMIFALAVLRSFKSVNAYSTTHQLHPRIWRQGSFQVISLRSQQRSSLMRSLANAASSNDNDTNNDSNKNTDTPTTVTTGSISELRKAQDDHPLWAPYRNKNNLRDQVFSAMSGDGGIKVTAATVRNLVNDMMLQHTLTETPTEALGRTVVCGLLMANGIQEEQVVQITLNGMSLSIEMDLCIHMLGFYVLNKDSICTRLFRYFLWTFHI
jgi:hypothetical protein